MALYLKMTCTVAHVLAKKNAKHLFGERKRWQTVGRDNGSHIFDQQGWLQCHFL